MFGLRFCARTFSSCSEQGPLFIEVHGPLTIAASPVAEHRLQTHRLSSCGSRAQPLRGMRDLPRPGLELVSPALAGRLPTTAPPGKPLLSFLLGKNQWFMPRTKCSIIPFLFNCILVPNNWKCLKSTNDIYNSIKNIHYLWVNIWKRCARI